MRESGTDTQLEIGKRALKERYMALVTSGSCLVARELYWGAGAKEPGLGKKHGQRGGEMVGGRDRAEQREGGV